MNNINISEMLYSDLENIKPILNTDFDDFWSYNILNSELKNLNSSYIVAKNFNNEILGFAGIWKSVDDVHITNIAVKRDFRKNGIGSILLEKLIEMSNIQPFTSLTLEVNAKNEAAINLYKKYNFKQIGLRKKYYNNIDDAIIMTLYFN
jgi:[ribosomal protein S18]-alanine N-acetyltransferase